MGLKVLCDVFAFLFLPRPDPRPVNSAGFGVDATLGTGFFSPRPPLGYPPRSDPPTAI